MFVRLLAVALLTAVALAGTARPAAAGYASIVIDAQTGQVLHEVNADTLNYPASLTKIMTLYVTFEALKGGRITLRKAMHVSEHASSQSPTKLGLRPGQTIMVVDAIFALITKSANDAAVVLAEEIGGTEWEFARMMTAKAAELGMGSTVFQNASGLPDLDQVSTARDLARLSQALIQNHPEYYGYFATHGFSYEGRHLESHNRFMKGYPGADGIKTGYIRASGFNLAGSAMRNGRRLISVVLGGETARWRDLHMAALLDRAFGDGTASMLASADDSSDEEARVAPAPTAVARPVPAAMPVTVAAAPLPRLPAALFEAESASTGHAAEITSVKRALASERATASKRSWTIQVGVFSDKGSARKVAEEALSLASLPSSAKVGVTAVKQGGKQLYRARLTGISQTVAQDACKKLERRKRDCRAFDDDA